MAADKSFSISAKLVAFVSLLASVLIAQEGVAVYLLFGVAMFYLVAQGQYKRSLQFLLSFGVLCLVWFLMITYHWQNFIISSFQIYFFWLMMPVFAVSWDLVLSPPGQISAFLSKHKAPTNVILAVLVIFRFFPTVKAEFQAIWQSMHNRGLLAVGQVCRHPLDSFEYILVPLLIRIVQISDQLTISALSRGIEAPVKRSAYYHKETTARDYACIVFFVLLAALVLCNEVIW